jgi:hypothetical protein
MKKLVEQTCLRAAFAALIGLGCVGGAQAETTQGQRLVAPAEAPLNRIMASLIDYKAFRISSAGFHQLVTSYCQRTDQQKDEYGVDAAYRCDAGTGIRNMKITTREGAATPTNYVMAIQLFLAADRYAPLKAQMQSRLGKPTKSGKDFVRYVYAGDKKLSRLGTPVISLSREDEQTVGFSVALEQGP